MTSLRIATWNVNSLRVRLDQVRQWLKTERPHIIALQETKLGDELFPIAAFSELGYQADFHGQKSYNGVATLSTLESVQSEKGIPGYPDNQSRVLYTRFREPEIGVLNLYVPNGAEIDSDKYRYKLEWLEQLAGYVKHLLQQNSRLVVLGDFNIAPTDHDLYDPQKWQGKVLVSVPEREYFQTLLRHGLADCFRRLHAQEPGYTWWDYRGGSFRRDHGLRIDHMLASEALARSCLSCVPDRTPRGWPRPSDHTPVLGAFET